jgi:hypothetical protein
MKTWVLIIVCLISESVSAQQFRLKVVDESTKAPVAYTELHLEDDKMRLFSDSAGVVTLPKDSKFKSKWIQLRRMGYLTERIKLDSLLKIKNATVGMISTTITFPEVRIKDEKAESVLLHVRKAILLSFQSEIVLSAFYRQAHVENDQLVFLAESELQTQYQKQKTKAERVSVLRLRAMPSIEKNKEKHSDHLIDLLSANPVFHPEGTILNIYTGDEFVFSYRRMEGDSSKYGEIKFSSADSIADFVETGRVVFLEDGYRIVLYESVVSLLPGRSGYKESSTGGGYRWFKQVEVKRFTYSWLNRQLFPQTMHQWYRHLLVHPVFDQVDYDLMESFSWSADSQIVAPPGPVKWSFDSNLYSGVFPCLSEREIVDENYFPGITWNQPGKEKLQRMLACRVSKQIIKHANGIR